MKIRQIGVTAISLALLTACGDASAERAAAPVVRDSSGIRIVENTEPLWATGDGWRLSDEPVLTIGMLDGPEAYQLDGVRAAIRIADNTIVVANGGSSQLRFYGPDGAHQRSVGGAGGGPGEFQSLLGLFRVGEDSIGAWDLRARRLTVFSNEGELGRTTSFDAVTGLAAQLRGILPDRSVIATPGTDAATLMSMASGERRDTLVLLRLSPEGTLLDTIARVPAAETVVDRSGSGFSMQPVLFGSSGYVSIDDGHVHTGSSDSFQTEARAPDGSLSRITRRSHEVRPVTPEILAAARTARAEARPGIMIAMSTADGAAPNLPEPQEPPHRDVLPAFDRLLADRAGNLWVRNYEPIGFEGDRSWSIFDAEGRLLGDVSIHGGLDVMEIGEDYVLGVWKDEFDVQYVQMYSLIHD